MVCLFYAPYFSHLKSNWVHFSPEWFNDWAVPPSSLYSSTEVFSIIRCKQFNLERLQSGGTYKFTSVNELSYTIIILKWNPVGIIDVMHWGTWQVCWQCHLKANKITSSKLGVILIFVLLFNASEVVCFVHSDYLWNDK